MQELLIVQAEAVSDSGNFLPEYEYVFEMNMVMIS